MKGILRNREAGSSLRENAFAGSSLRENAFAGSSLRKNAFAGSNSGTGGAAKRRPGGLFRRRAAALVLVAALFAGVLQMPVLTQAASKTTCKSLAKAALEETGGSSKLKYQTTKKDGFSGFTVSDSKKVSSLVYLCDAKEVYALCVVKATSKSNASKLLNSLKAYKKQNSSSDYLSDYSSTEQKVFKNAVCGKKGKYVWYIAMSTSTSVNRKGQTEIKELL